MGRREGGRGEDEAEDDILDSPRPFRSVEAPQVLVHVLLPVCECKGVGGPDGWWEERQVKGKVLRSFINLQDL